MLREPVMRTTVQGVIDVEKRYENVDVEKRLHQ